MIENQNTDFDPMAWANMNHIENSNEKQGEPVEQASPVVYPQTDTEAEVREVARRLVERGIDITSGYGNWLNLGFALADGLGEGGRELYHQLSTLNSGYNHSECDRQYSACLKSHGRGVTIKSFFQMAKLGGIDLAEVAREQLLQAPTSATFATFANLPVGKNMQKSSKMGFFDDFDSNLAIGKLAKVAKTSSCQTFSDKLNWSDFPTFLAPVFDSQADAVGVDKMLLRALNLISGILPDSLYSIYDRRKIHAPLYNIGMDALPPRRATLRL